MELKDLLKRLDGVFHQDPDGIRITQIAYDSRLVEAGGLFVAIRGERWDGHAFIQEALARGAVAIVAEEGVSVPEHIHLTVVKNARKALSSLSAMFYGEPSRSMKVVGVTGTNGKTTTVAFLKAILEEAGYAAGSLGTLGLCWKAECAPLSHTTPESLELQSVLQGLRERHAEALAMEVSSHALAQHRVEDVHFAWGVFTNLTHEHLDFHGDMESYYHTKRRLFTELSQGAVVNGDDPYGALLRRELLERGKPLLTFGLSKAYEVHAEDLTLHPEEVTFLLRVFEQEGRVRLRLPGRYNVYNALAAAAAATALGIPLEAVVKGLEKTQRVPGRFERFLAADGLQVIVDYAHTPDGLHQLLETVGKTVSGEVWSVLGAPGERDHSKRPVMGAVLESHGVRCLLTTDNPRSEDPLIIAQEIRSGFRNKSRVEILLDRGQAVDKAIQFAGREDLVIITGKGNEHGQIVQGARLDYDELEAVHAALEKRNRRGAEK